MSRRKLAPWKHAVAPRHWQVNVTAAPEGATPPVLFDWTEDARDGTFATSHQAVALHRVRFKNVRFEAPRLALFIARGATLADCTFTGKLADSGLLGALPDPRLPSSQQFGRTIYRDCQFIDCALTSLDPGWARFESCVFQRCKMVRWYATDAEFVDCRFPQTTLKEATFCGTGLLQDANGSAIKNEFRNNDFTGADLRWVTFRNGIDLGAQILPPDAGLILTRFHERIKWAESAMRQWERERRKFGLFVLEILAGHAGREQRDVFVHRVQIEDPGTTDVYRDVYALLEQAPV